MFTDMSHLPLQHINGESLNDEQRKYLDGFFAGLTAQGVSFGDAEPVPAGGKKILIG